ncbi:hypothetical protein LOK49_LG10G00551 [Camellia lanceoleosa]|uniref:Uncharacterized protein n=1 Tax=Camellia lanceoleosa TaxID=1840588 RepID=A0ACC0G8U1_9ERIC|nr:hypothetical protein LOK49_LG10G00551 [Camellia lanceoleosa]
MGYHYRPLEEVCLKRMSVKDAALEPLADSVPYFKELVLMHCDGRYRWSHCDCQQLQIGDLGLSKVKQHTSVLGGVRGTLPWMAPELLSGKSNIVTEKIDAYSFGIVTWELLTRDESYADMHCASILEKMSHRKFEHPLYGSLGFIPQKRAAQMFSPQHAVRESLRASKKEFNKIEDNLKSLQSIEQIIGEILKPLNNERLIVKASSGPRYIVGCSQ